MFNDSVHPKGFFETIFFAMAGTSYLIMIAILIIALVIVTFTR